MANPPPKFLQWILDHLKPSDDDDTNSLITLLAHKGVFIEIMISTHSTVEFLLIMYSYSEHPNTNMILEEKDNFIDILYTAYRPKRLFFGNLGLVDMVMHPPEKLKISSFACKIPNQKELEKFLYKMNNKLIDINDFKFVKEVIYKMYNSNQSKIEYFLKKKHKVTAIQPKKVCDKDACNRKSPLFNWSCCLWRKKKDRKRVDIVRGPSSVKESETKLSEFLDKYGNELDSTGIRKRKDTSKRISVYDDAAEMPPYDERESLIQGESKAETNVKLPVLNQSYESDDDEDNWETVAIQGKEIIPDFTFRVNIGIRKKKKNGIDIVDYHISKKACPFNTEPLKHIEGLLILIVGNKKLTDAEKFRLLLNCLYLRYIDYEYYIHASNTPLREQHLKPIKEVAAVLFVLCRMLDIQVDINMKNDREKELFYLQTKIQQKTVRDYSTDILFGSNSRQQKDDFKRKIESIERMEGITQLIGDFENEINAVENTMNDLTNRNFDLKIFKTESQLKIFNRMYKELNDIGKQDNQSTSVYINNMTRNIYKRFNEERPHQNSPTRKRRCCKDCKINLLNKPVVELKNIAKYLGCKQSSKLNKSELVRFIMKNS